MNAFCNTCRSLIDPADILIERRPRHRCLVRKPARTHMDAERSPRVGNTGSDKRRRAAGGAALAAISPGHANSDGAAAAAAVAVPTAQMIGLSITPPRGAAGAPTSREAVTPTDALEAELHTPQSKQADVRVVLYMAGSFCPVHSQHIRALERAKASIEAAQARTRVVGAFIAPAHDDRVSQEYAASGKSSWFLPWECRIQLVDLALADVELDSERLTRIRIVADRWPGVQKSHVSDSEAQADLQRFLDGWCAEEKLPAVQVIRVMEESEGDAGHDEVLGDDWGRTFARDGATSADVRAAFHSEGGAGEMLHPAVAARLRDWWRAPRALQFPLPDAWTTELSRFQRPLAALADLPERLGLQAPLSPILSEEFCAKTYVMIVSAAAELAAPSTLSDEGIPERSVPIELQSAGVHTDDVSHLLVQADTYRGLLASMLLGIPPPLTALGGDEEDGEMLQPRGLTHLFTATAGTQAEDSLRAVLAYFGSQPRKHHGSVQIQRCVLAKEVDFAARSPRPMMPLTFLTEADDAWSETPEVEVLRVSRFACGGNVDQPAAAPYCDPLLRPELLAAALLCPALRRDEALAVRGAEMVRNITENREECVNELLATKLLIDFSGVAPPVETEDKQAMVQAWLAKMRRDLEKANCAFAAGSAYYTEKNDSSAVGESVRSSLANSESWEDMLLDVAVQWMAASEAGCALELRLPPADAPEAMQRNASLGASVASLLSKLATPARADFQAPTVGWMWARLTEHITEKLSGTEVVEHLFVRMMAGIVEGAVFPAGTAPADLAAVVQLEQADAAALAAGLTAVADDAEEEQPRGGGARGGRVARGGGARGGTRSLFGGGGGGGGFLAEGSFGGGDDDEVEMSTAPAAAARGLFGGSDSDEEVGCGAGAGAGTGWTSSDEEEESRPARRLF